MKTKIFGVIMLMLVVFSMVLPTSYAKEKTLNELEAEAKANREAYNKAKNEKELTEAERDKATAQKAEVEKEISSIETQLDSIGAQIEEIQKDIDAKDEQMKDIMSFVQVTNGDSNYLEYIFGATDFTDFIYRISVAEQLGNYNEQLIEEYNADVEKLDNKQSELNTKQEELNKKQSELTVLEAQLNKEIETLQSGMISKDQAYKTQIELIQSMKARGCKDTDTVTSCQNRGSNLPSVNGTHMPINGGYVTSDYGYRSYDDSFHTGIDYSKSVAGDPVYPIADGEVILLNYNRSCGNHIVYVKHNINGHSYITSYWHLSSWSVSVGQKVSYTTQIGKMAGRNSGDSCSGGIHVHLNLFDNANNKWENNVARGGNPNSGRINPRTVVPQTPAKGGHFSGR